MKINRLPIRFLGLAAGVFLLATPVAQAGYWGYNNIAQNQTWQVEFTPRTTADATYWSVGSIASIGGYGGIQQQIGTQGRWALFSLWDNGTAKDVVAAGFNPFLGYSEIGRFDGEGDGGKFSYTFNWELNKTYRFAYRRFVVPGRVGPKVRYAQYIHDPYVAGGWFWVGTLEKPMAAVDAQNMNGFEGFTEDWNGPDYPTREIDIRNVWMLGLGNNWVNINSAAEHSDGYDNQNLIPIAGGWKVHAYDETYPNQNNDHIASLPDSSIAPIHIPYLINSGGNVTASQAETDQVAASLTRAYEPDSYWNGTSSGGYTSSRITLAGVANAAPHRLYKTYRQGMNFGYTLFGLQPNTATTVRLHFSEPAYDTAGSRKAKIVINGTTVESSLDIRAAAGAKNKALVRDYTVTPGSDGRITIALTSLVSGVNAIVSGIEAGSIAAGPAPIANGLYRLTPKVNAGSALEASTTAGTQLDIRTWSDSAAQKFRISYLHGGYYRIQLSADATKVLDVNNASAAPDVIKTWVENGSPAQKWKIVEAGDGYFKLQPQCASVLTMDIYYANSADGSLVQTWNDTAGDGQRWKLERLD
jgi:Ricin-type beta-trefoil lectin domain-like/Malectin domain/Domain of unknown function (DUF3472)